MTNWTKNEAHPGELNILAFQSGPFFEQANMVKCRSTHKPIQAIREAPGDNLVDISNAKSILTRQGYDDIQRELEEILTVKRPALVERIRQARLLGDLSENFDYQDAKRQQGMLEARIKQLKQILAQSTVIDNVGHNGEISIGSTVVVKDVEEGYEDRYIIVGSAESSPSEGKISHESLIGGALMGRKVGDMFSVETPGGTVQYEIMSVQ